MELVKIKLKVDPKVIVETLTRIGIPDYKNMILYPSCYLYNNFGDYYIAHFKEMFLVERQNGYNNLSEQDIRRRNSIIFCLMNWDMIEVPDLNNIEPHDTKVFVLPFKDKHNWKINHKFRSNYKDGN